VPLLLGARAHPPHVFGPDHAPQEGKLLESYLMDERSREVLERENDELRWIVASYEMTVPHPRG
jgi:hypothetical protein